MKKAGLFIMGVLITIGIYAQNGDTVVVKRIHEFGIHAGTTTAVGLSYRYWPNKLGLQLTLLPVKTTDETFISAGITGLYSFYDSRLIRFFGYFGNNLTVNNYKNYNYQYNPIIGIYESTYTFKHNRKYNIGFGPGFGFGTRVRVNIMAGYGFYDIFGEFNIYPTGEIGLYFRI
jgi:hypothetical protein